MLDITQTLLIVVITVLTILLAIIGVQVFYILRDLRQTTQRANRILEDTMAMTSKFRKPFSSVTSLASGIKTGLEIFHMLKEKKEKPEKS